ncbi:Protein ALP1-like [Bagarius yarrelli]|uniref:Protein ALP1-like n=1 Tax=Bagarius yarrelli TaxID=175774 RepID=A0A556TUX2_BAGYA|nr:Protein ALP1-like [Bagarius yarrelli]
MFILQFLLLQLSNNAALLQAVSILLQRRRRAFLERATALGPSVRLAPIPTKTRSCWMRVRSRDWWERVVLHEFSDAEWREHFRMCRRSFVKLCNLMKDVISPGEMTVRPAIPLEMRVAIALYKLGGCAEYRSIAYRFGVHNATVMKFVYMFCKGMVNQAIRHFIKVPNPQEARAIAERFQSRFCIPQVIGCVDVTHIPVLAPRDGHMKFLNLKFVLNLQKKAHDCHVGISHSLFSGIKKNPCEINGTPINFIVLGDAAYPLLEWLIKAYTPSPTLTAQQNSFNSSLNDARAAVEIAFQRLKARWRVLLKKGDFHYTFLPYVAITCCALHNFCEREKEDLGQAWMEEVALMERTIPQPPTQSYTQSSTAGEAVRQVLTEYVASSHMQER